MAATGDAPSKLVLLEGEYEKADMIERAHGNLLEADAEALVNTVNCVGHMGKGIALQFKKAYPENFRHYARAAAAGEVTPGAMTIFETGTLSNPRFIVNFPTKRHWRGKSRIEDIESGLRALAADVARLNIASIAIPPLGCGLGGLKWSQVEPLIRQTFDELPGVRVLLFAPEGTPDARTMPIGTKRPRLTIARALFLSLMGRYNVLAYRLTLLEVQKLAYLLQEAGEPLRLRYEKGMYGPYAANLNKVLEVLEGHYIRGYGDTQKPDVEIKVMEGALEEADAFLEGHSESLRRLNAVADLIEGFETPYGMELLASLHWVAVHEPNPARTLDTAVAAVKSWNDRKRMLFSDRHLAVGWERLTESGMLPK